MPLHPPYPPTTAGLGGLPTIKLDVPICAVFLALFIGAAAGHMTIFQINKRRGHKFLMSGLMFGFCMARITTMVMRIVWATRPTNIRVVIAAQVFVTAGVIILWLINLIFAQRLIRAAHPNFGWHRAFSRAFMVLYILIVIFLGMIITVVVQSFYTLNANTKRIDRDIQLTAITYYLLIAFLPLPMVIIGLIVPRETRIEKFGTGRWRSKVRILLGATVLLCLGAAFRTATTFKPLRPRDDPAWYQSKACFYTFNFVVEIIVIYLYLLVRVDKRFHIPDGASQVGDYSGRNLKEGMCRNGDANQSPRVERRIMTEEEVFDDVTPVESNEQVKKDEEMGVAR